MKNKKILLVFLCSIIGMMSVFFLFKTGENYDDIKNELVVEDSNLKKQAEKFSKKVITLAQKNNSLAFSKKLKIDEQLGQIIFDYTKKIEKNAPAVAVNCSEKVRDYLYVYYKNSDKFYKFQLVVKNNKWQLLNVVEVDKIG